MKSSGKYLFVFVVLTLLLASCSKRRMMNSKARVQYSEDKSMWVIDKDYYLDDSILIHFAVPHPRELAIKSPSGTFYYLVYPANLPTIPKGKPILSIAEFQKKDQLLLIPASTKANPHDIEFKGNHLIFKKSGTYEILLSDNLSTDDGTSLQKLNIHYHHEIRPPRV